MSRKLERHTLTQPIPIWDVINGGLAGELINISREGLMLISEREIETQAIFQFALQLPEPLEESSDLQLGADCLWCRPNDQGDRFWAGFQIIDAADRALAQIDALIRLYTTR